MDTWEITYMLKYQVEGGDYYYDGDFKYIIYRRYGLSHRRDHPAELWGDGEKQWCEYGQMHRKDGPALTYSNGDKEYWNRGTKQC